MSVSAGPPSDREGKVGTALVAGGPTAEAVTGRRRQANWGPAMAVLERGRGERAAGGRRSAWEKQRAAQRRACVVRRGIQAFSGALESVVYSALPLVFCFDR